MTQLIRIHQLTMIVHQYCSNLRIPLDYYLYKNQADVEVMLQVMMDINAVTIEFHHTKEIHSIRRSVFFFVGRNSTFRLRALI